MNTNITDTNKLIAEFMGEFNVYEENGRFKCNNCDEEFSACMGDNEIPMIHADCNPDIIVLAQYHTSWDWLLPVVLKINNFSIQGAPEIKITKRVEVFYSPLSEDGSTEVKLFEHWEDFTLDSVYQAVITFVKWYNHHT